MIALLSPIQSKKSNLFGVGYVRKLLESIINIRGGFILDFLDNSILVRIRSKRLKTLEISGHMRQKDIFDIIKKQFEEVPHNRLFEIEKIIETAQGICNTPADYTSFTEKAIALCSTEYKILLKLRQLKESTQPEKCDFIKLNFKTIIGILAHVDHITSQEDYPLVDAHLESARREISRSPVRKGSIQLNEFLETELSKEPQVGFIIGVDANDMTGMLLPIATSLTRRVERSPIIVTGAVSSSSASSAELDMAVPSLSADTEKNRKSSFVSEKNVYAFTEL